MKLPTHMNAWQLGKVLDEDPAELLKIIREQTHEIITDEFQILSKETIETVCLELEYEV